MKAAFLNGFSLGPARCTSSARKSLCSCNESCFSPKLYRKRRVCERTRNRLECRLDANVKAQRLVPQWAENGAGAPLGSVHSVRDALVAEVVQVAGPDRGIFAMNEFQRESIASALDALERNNPTAAPVRELERKLVGKWRLVYTDRMILGWRRTQLYLTSNAKPGLVHLGEVTQTIHAPETTATTATSFHDVHIAASGCAENQVEFRIFGGIQGLYAVAAVYGTDAQDGMRVWVQSQSSSLQPAKFASMMNEQRQQTLKELFDPTGHLDVTYVDDSYRITRDDKGFVYLWERVPAI